jgi:pyruvate dehydrogenase E2 component (dihydrolipoamide acetyltransferase)
VPDVLMPRLSDSMEEGTIVRWLRSDGDEVRRGDEILEIETDKATMTYEADTDGALSIAVAEGATVPVGAVIGRIGAPSALQAAAAAAPSAAVAAAAAGNGAGPAGSATVASPPSPATDSVSASPVARRMALRLGIDLAAIVGTGPHGRIRKADVRVAAPASARQPPSVPAEQAAPPAAPTVPSAAAPVAPAPAPGADGARGTVTVEELSRAQALIARRMAESRATVPDFALEVEVDMTAALELRSGLKALGDSAPSVNDIVVKACAVALRRHPRANGSYRDGRFELHARVNVGVAVAAQDSLVVPTVHDADVKSLGAIAAETRRLVGRVRSGQITPPELAGGTFTVSNLGMFGIDRFEGIISAPQAAILCVGAIRERPVAIDGELAVRPTMSMTLACDHRILYGADAAEFLAEVRRFLEQPLAMAL